MAEKIMQVPKISKKRTFRKKTPLIILQWFSTKNTMMFLVLTLTPNVIFKVISRTTVLYYGKIRIMDCMSGMDST